ncbi:hypothetical protein SJA_C1-18100 [Sphingobium indicum UT26S]|uniref:Uncharacterized protein n=1 Tax=Sphingobium indicum (strain DSM 16413 / CCM 7287 / MTCC 6362 / UT26 / NBRC 101211 / UT26S) TaxID=452662 RepID=D4Z212_SPHIU|nr:hypothetical protein SJA_C1-18100 [Sphingobium indicum UT26S]
MAGTSLPLLDRLPPTTLAVGAPHLHQMRMGSSGRGVEAVRDGEAAAKRAAGEPILLSRSGGKIGGDR